MRAWSYLVVVGALAGCAGKTIDAGSNDAGLGSNGQPGTSSGQTGASSGGSSGAPAEVFKGYVESFMFPSGSDTVVMNLAFGADGAVTGTVFFGDGPPLAPPTNPDVGYPPGYNGLTDNPSPEGFAYTVLSGTDAAPRVTLQVETLELFKKWCELQTPIPQYSGGNEEAGIDGYGCLPSDGYSSSGGSNCTLVPEQGPSIPVDCGKLSLCIPPRVCACTATGCTTRMAPMGDVRFDMQLTGADLSGSVTGLGGQAYNVHLTRSP